MQVSVTGSIQSKITRRARLEGKIWYEAKKITGYTVEEMEVPPPTPPMKICATFPPPSFFPKKLMFPNISSRKFISNYQILQKYRILKIFLGYKVLRGRSVQKKADVVYVKIPLLCSSSTHPQEMRH